MPMLINCDNRGCCKYQPALLNTADNTVICSECLKPIQNVTVFAKQQLKQLGQTISNRKPKAGFSVKCQHCQSTDTPQRYDQQWICSNCKQELTNMSDAFKHLLQDVIKKPV